MKLIQDFMPVLVICKFEEDPIKTEDTIVSTIFFQHSRAGNSKVNIQMWPEFELIQDFIAPLVTSKFDDNPIKNEGAIGSTFSPL